MVLLHESGVAVMVFCGGDGGALFFFRDGGLLQERGEKMEVLLVAELHEVREWMMRGESATMVMNRCGGGGFHCCYISEGMKLRVVENDGCSILVAGLRWPWWCARKFLAAAAMRKMPELCFNGGASAN